MVEGELSVRTYEKDGRAVQAWEVVVPRFGGSLLLLGKRESHARHRGNLPSGSNKG